MVNPSDFLDHGALGLSLFVLLLAVAVLFRVLQWARSIFDLILSRIESNTSALVRLAERLHGEEDES